MDEYRPIPGYEGLYTISRDGLVYNVLKKKSANPEAVSKTACYPRVWLRKRWTRERFAVHRLVLLAFVGPCPEGKEANHKNGVKTDFRLENLEYVTKSENQQHSVHVLRKRSQKGSTHGQSKLTEEQAIAIRKARDEGRPIADIAAEYGISSGTVSMIASGKIWKHVVPNHRSVPRFRVR